MKKYTLILVFIICFSVNAQNSYDSLKIISKTEIEMLKQRNQDLLDFQEKLSATIYWSLGFSATFLILFLGINIYFLRNRYNEDKERFLKHIEDTLSVKAGELDKKIVEIVGKTIDSKLSSVKNSIESLKEQLSMIEIKTNDNKIEILEINKSHKDTILYYYFEQAKTCKSTGDFFSYGWKISNCMDAMKKLLDDGAKFDAAEVTEVTKFLDSLPSQFSDTVFSFREKLRKSSV